MQIVIDIPKEMYQKIKETNMFISGRRSGRRFDYILFNAVNTGTLLPKGHGRLIDANELSREMYNEAYKDSGCWIKYKTFENVLKDAPTIIEADMRGDKE